MESVKKIYLTGEVEFEETLDNLIEQAGDVSLFDTLIMEISSQGGSVEEGLKIMVWMDQISSLNKKVITVVTANAYSIASLIMLVADEIYVSEHAEVMVHNPMIPFIEYANANELDKAVEELRFLEKMLRALYVQFSNIKEDDIKILMDNETFISPEDAVRKGLAHKVINIKPRPYSMMVKKNVINMSETRNQLHRIIAAVQGKKIVNQLYYNTAGGQIEVYQSNPTAFAVGDKTDLEKGEERLLNGTVLKIEGFEIKNVEKEVPVQEPEAEPEAVVEETKEVKDDAPVNGEFNTGPAPEEPVVKDIDMMIPGAPTTDVEKVIDAVEGEPVTPVAPEAAVEPVAPVAPVEPEAAAEPIIPAVPVEPEAAVEPVVEPIAEPEAADESGEIIANLTAMVESLIARIETLEGGAVDSAQTEALVAEAIDTLAQNTSSAFKPEAIVVKKKEVEAEGTSIFTRLQAKAQLRK